ncbi:hypothetical protein HSBAA_42210 [Vreelandella sulfidaeris]|uniref:Uncharacterized protein n=1 Tax=Vreelandella sulfidaeris TaxID=115553 RepID=A0A455UA71_9GAMM|nr:hypothetical protein HSBAA_42210 [Halomonas sulfidaeris]
MANIAHEPVKKAMNRIKQLSADEETRRLAFVRERALRDEVSLSTTQSSVESKKAVRTSLRSSLR